MRSLTTASFAAAAVLATATFSTPVAAGALFGSIVVFGTSSSDSGNAFALRGGTNTPPDGLPTSSWDGIHPTKAVHSILAQETAAAFFY